MDPSPTAPDGDTLARTLVEQILITGMMLADLVTDLLDGLPAGAFPGESHADVVLEMLAGTSAAAVAEAGPDVVRRTVVLIHEVGDCILADLRAAAALAEQGEGSRSERPRRDSQGDP